MLSKSDSSCSIAPAATSVALALAVLVISLLAGCAASEDAGDRTPRRVRSLDRANPSMNVAFAADARDVATVQLHDTQSETSTPVVVLGGQNTLTLAFDLLADQGRPVSVYFYHADREWRRDLSPSEYLETYHRDNILDYRPSQATEVPYVHYRYSFPNDVIQFRLSGNYIVRVSEQGDEDAVLLERSFFVSEQSTPVDLLLDNVFVPSYSFPAVQPTAAFTPPAEMQADLFSYTVCFAQDGRYGDVRCSDNPSLMNQPTLSYYLQPRSSFAPAGSDYVLELARLQAGGQIAGIDVTASPFEVRLAPDYVRFGADATAPRLYGHAVVEGAVFDVPEPQIQAEYVETTFALVTDGEVRLTGDVYLVGAFTGWRQKPAGKMTWNDTARRYEVTLVLKQGRYEYRFTSPDEQVQSRLAQSLPREGERYAALVYYRDARIQTDRLVGFARRSRL